MYKLKDVARRGSALLGAVGLLAGVGTSVLPAVASADALNPLTERSLTLSSSSPGWSYLDGSGNTTYAPPNSGANGQKTGNTFSFRMSSDGVTVKAITFQYCTSPAGNCTAPGDNTLDAVDGDTIDDGTGTITVNNGDDEVTGSGTAFISELNAGSRIVTAGGEVYTVLSVDTPTTLTLTANASGPTETGVAFEYREADTASTSDLNITMPSETLITSGDWTTISASADKTPAADGSEGEFVVLTRDFSTLGAGTPTTYTTATDWTATSSNSETGSFAAGTATGQKNLITLKSATGKALDSQDYVKVVFFGTTANYITNPGSGAFFVRINTYSDDTTLDDTTLLDGGVTVANVMNESISIQTKVLETMDFSVGTHDPDLYLNDDLTDVGEDPHAQCSTLLMKDPALGVDYAAAPHNVLQLGDANAEYSLRTDTAYDVQSYWRLSSNSSGGATVYYTGHTLTNTVGDEIAPLNEAGNGGTGTQSLTGTEQFGLAISHDTLNLNVGPGGSSVETYPVQLEGTESYGTENTPDDGDFGSYIKIATDAGKGDDFVHYPRLYPLVPMDPYASGSGTIVSSGTAKFAFNANADTYAIPIATESDQVVNCVTAKMRYIANIAATTPAGIYTTKVNYVASPQY